MRKKIPKRIQKQALERDNYNCVFSFCKEGNLQLHHVEWISQGGSNEVGNLATLCPLHHAIVHHDKYSVATLKRIVSAHRNLMQLEKRSRKYPRRIYQAHDSDLTAALKLYENEFPEDERDSAEDIKRWIDEAVQLKGYANLLIQKRESIDKLPLKSLETTISSSVDPGDFRRDIRDLKRLKDDKESYREHVLKKIQYSEQYIWVHKRQAKICGFLYYEYNYEYKLAFVSYLVSKGVKSTDELVQKGLVEQLKVAHPECIGVVAEFE